MRTSCYQINWLYLHIKTRGLVEGAMVICNFDEFETEAREENLSNIEKLMER